MADRVINDFSIRIATPNGTGSTSANDIIFRALFHMGLAPSAKNLFPSNIQGMPTWFQIRVSPEGYQARRENWEILLPLNPETLAVDLDESRPGTVVLYNSDSPLADGREEELVCYGLPLDTLARKNLKDAKLRPKLRNMIYVGALAELFGIPHDSVRAGIRSVFKKDKVVDVNWEACQLGVDYVRENLPKRDPYSFETATQTDGKILIDGNEAAALGSIFGGCTFVAWYPITPASSLTEAFIPHAEQLRTIGDGTRRVAVIQAEDELAAIGMALGAGWSGARAMTATSGPGVSLMAENMGFGYFAEIPAVLFDVQRVGPSTGMPTRTQQSDLLQVAFLSHGDTRFPMLFPATPAEAFEFSWRAFDAAERLQSPVVVMSDLDLGMNTWVDRELEYPDRPFDRGKVLSDEKLAELESWGRYRDVDGDGIPWRSLPGRMETPRAAYFTRGSGHDESARYTERADKYSANLDRLARKIDGAPAHLPAPEFTGHSDAEVGLLAFGSSHSPILEALDRVPDARVGYLRVRSWPFHDEVESFLARSERVVVVEQNQQGQMAALLKIDFPQHAAKIESALYYGGLPLSAAFVVENALEPLRKGQ
ncbi:MAG: 2-oxoacid:acceptor oxidoreductase subunit alpha [Planctomycetes bacterium]|nr:2-oxoacid:acceptor oxidoreductase subunit alpha [Planctomycetota bacterium]